MSILKPSHDDDQSQTSAPQDAALEFEASGFVEQSQTKSDLSGEILRILPRAQGEWITCRRIGNSHYRCNWWSPRDSSSDDNPLSIGLRVTTHRVGRSDFIHALQTPGGLKMTMVSGGSASPMVVLREAEIRIVSRRVEGPAGATFAPTSQ
jgi:hypothetical protein